MGVTSRIWIRGALAMASGDCDEALKTIVGGAAQNPGYDNVKAEQMKVVAIYSVVYGRDVFAVLPTGFGIASRSSQQWYAN